jgi:hypothetical protein
MFFQKNEKFKHDEAASRIATNDSHPHRSNLGTIGDMKTTGARAVFGLLAVAVIFAAIMTARYLDLRKQNATLRAQQTQQIEPVQTPRGTVAQDPLSNAEKLELMRLRNEVTQLRASVAAAKQQVQNALENRDRALGERRQVAALDQNGQEAGQLELKTSEVMHRGFATPADGFISALAAMKEGDVAAMAQVMTPEERARWEQSNGGKTGEELQARFRKEFGTNSTLRVSGQEQLSPTEVVLDVEMERPFTKRVRMNLVDNEWKAGAPINQNKQAVAANPMANPEAAANNQAEEYDPLAFYRKNPELMKRYFPHLYQQNAAAQAQPTAQGTLPPEPSPNQ